MTKSSAVVISSSSKLFIEPTAGRNKAQSKEQQATDPLQQLPNRNSGARMSLLLRWRPRAEAAHRSISLGLIFYLARRRQVLAVTVILCYGERLNLKKR